MAPRVRLELTTLRLTAECSTVELPGIRATLSFSLYYRKLIHAMTFRREPGALARLRYVPDRGILVIVMHLQALFQAGIFRVSVHSVQ